MTLLLGALLLALAAPARAATVHTAEDVARFIDAASSHILLVSPSLTSPPVAEALHRAVTRRGVQLHVLAEASQVELPASYLPAVSRLPSVQVRLVGRVAEDVLLIDRRYLLRGPLVWRLVTPLEQLPTTATDLQTEPLPQLEAWLAAINDLWQRAPVYYWQP